MTCFAHLSQGPSNPETIVGLVAILGLAAAGIWLILRRLVNRPATPDPWDEQTARDMARDDAVPLCHRCLTPHADATDFCPECGAPVGQYTNWLPFPYLFSVGHALRLGTSGEFKRSKLTVIGFFVFALVEYAVFAPIYWIVFLCRLRKPRPTHPSQLQPTSEGSGTSV